MKKYVTPNVILLFLEYQDICTASISEDGTAIFYDYNFEDDAWF